VFFRVQVIVYGVPFTNIFDSYGCPLNNKHTRYFAIDHLPSRESMSLWANHIC
jgi:hypothetical protein